jgi:signal transduction histidine kinase
MTLKAPLEDGLPTNTGSALGLREKDLQNSLAEALATIADLQKELAQTNREVMALTLELEQRVDQRTQELLAAHAELKSTNSELLQLTLELEDRVTERTAELQAKSEEMRVMSQQLWQAAKLATMGELAASIAHELNNPLATVSLRVESILAEIPAGDSTHRVLEIVAHEVERMANLVANLLQFSRRSVQEFADVEIADEIERTLELIYYHLVKRGIKVVRDIGDGIPAVYADREQLTQLFLNLFSNASDAMPAGGTLTIRARMNGALVIEIADTGVGILPEPFFTTKPEGKGTGLGLAICRRAVLNHRGTLEITSDGVAGKGTTIRIILPVAATPAPLSAEGGSQDVQFGPAADR